MARRIKATGEQMGGVHFRLDDADRERYEQIAKARRMTLSEFIRSALEYFAARH